MNAPGKGRWRSAWPAALVYECLHVGGARSVCSHFLPYLNLRVPVRHLGCIVPPGMTTILPSGHSLHYEGTVPMQRRRRRFTCTPDCRSHDFRKLYFADGATCPFPPPRT
jgi:hypothetical protein